MWYHDFESGTPAAIHSIPMAYLGEHGPFRVYLDHRSADPNYERGPGAQSRARAEAAAEQDSRWILHAASPIGPGVLQAVYAFEFPHERAHEIRQMFPQTQRYIATQSPYAPLGDDIRREEGRDFENQMDQQEREREREREYEQRHRHTGWPE